MQQTDLLTEHAPKAPSDAYYALVFSPKEARIRLIALFAFTQMVQLLGKNPKDPDVARRQLHWWREETLPTQLEKSQHPFLRMMQEGPNASRLQTTELSRALQQITQSALNELTQSRYLDRAALIDHLLAAFGAFGQAVALLGMGISDLPHRSEAHLAEKAAKTSEPTSSLLASARQLGLALGLGQVMVNLAQDARLGTVYLPVSDLQRAPIRAHELIKGLTRQLDAAQQAALQPAMRTLLSDHIRWFEDVQANALAGATANDLRTLKPLLILLTLTRKTITRRDLNHPFAPRGQLELNPLHKFWSAWKIQALGRI